MDFHRTAGCMTELPAASFPVLAESGTCRGKSPPPRRFGRKSRRRVMTSALCRPLQGVHPIPAKTGAAIEKSITVSLDCDSRKDMDRPDGVPSSAGRQHDHSLLVWPGKKQTAVDLALKVIYRLSGAETEPLLAISGYGLYSPIIIIPLDPHPEARCELRPAGWAIATSLTQILSSVAIQHALAS